MKAMRHLMLGLILAAGAGLASGQSANPITAVSPTSAVQGASGLTVTFTLDTNSPPRHTAAAAGLITHRRASLAALRHAIISVWVKSVIG